MIILIYLQVSRVVKFNGRKVKGNLIDNSYNGQNLQQHKIK